MIDNKLLKARKLALDDFLDTDDYDLAEKAIDLFIDYLDEEEELNLEL